MSGLNGVRSSAQSACAIARRTYELRNTAPASLADFGEGQVRGERSGTETPDQRGETSSREDGSGLIVVRFVGKLRPGLRFNFWASCSSARIALSWHVLADGAACRPSRCAIPRVGTEPSRSHYL